MSYKKLVAAYCRVSTLEQKKKGYGIDIQVRDITLFAQAQGLVPHRFYKDEGISGTEAHRRGLKKLLRDCRQGQIEAVIIPSLDRLSRDVRLAENLFWQFEQLGVQVLMADMPNYNGQDRRDVLLRQIREAMAEENRKDIIERLWKGRQERIRRGKPPGGNLAYGYLREGHEVQICPKEAEMVRLVFDWNARGESPTAISRMLNEQGYVRRNGRSWTPRQVSALLRKRELYEHGIISYGPIKGENKDLILVRHQTTDG